MYWSILDSGVQNLSMLKSWAGCLMVGIYKFCFVCCLFLSPVVMPYLPGWPGLHVCVFVNQVQDL